MIRRYTLYTHYRRSRICVYPLKKTCGYVTTSFCDRPFSNSRINSLKKINSVLKAISFQLRLLAKVKSYLPRKEFESVIHAFITSRLDYCNSLYVGLDQPSLQRLQLVQKAAARLLTGTKNYEHITPVLPSLHWLSVRFRIEFKILLIVFFILHGLAPAYLSELLNVNTPVKALRSSNHVLLDVLRARLKNKGDIVMHFGQPWLFLYVLYK